MHKLSVLFIASTLTVSAAFAADGPMVNTPAVDMPAAVSDIKTNVPTDSTTITSDPTVTRPTVSDPAVSATTARTPTPHAPIADKSVANPPATNPSATEAAPQPMIRHGGPSKGGLFAGLRLTEEQREEMRDIMTASHQNGSKWAKEERNTLHELVASDNFDDATVKTQIETLNKARSERMLERVRADNKIYNLLTLEQKKRYNENYQKREQKIIDNIKKMKAHQAAVAAANSTATDK